MKFSKKFERDFEWLLKSRKKFNFDGNLNYTTKDGRNIIVPDKNGKSAKECFYIFDSTGLIEPCRQPKLLHSLLRCKGSINFNIKAWAEERGNGFLGKIEFLEIVKEFSLLDWMIESVENQRMKYWRNV
jgi:hypothetical protein